MFRNKTPKQEENLDKSTLVRYYALNRCLKRPDGEKVEAKITNEILSKDFSALTEKNKKSVIEMTRLLVLTQNTIVPKILNPETDILPIRSEKRSAKGQFC